MIDLYFWATPNGLKISIMLEETGLPYTIKFIDISNREQFAPDFLAIAPNNRIPAIVDHDAFGGKALPLFESGAILLHLARKSGQFYPFDDPIAAAKVEQWLMWQVGGFGPMLGQNHHFALYAKEQIPYAIKRYRDETHRLYAVLDRQLAQSEYIAGAYSIADMACLPWARSWEKQAIDLDKFPHVRRWAAALEARPGVERGILVGAEERARSAAQKDQSGRAALYDQRGVSTASS
jgi:GSH-dependent disulfide-bond oxidoreductase